MFPRMRDSEESVAPCSLRSNEGLLSEATCDAPSPVRKPRYAFTRPAAMRQTDRRLEISVLAPGTQCPSRSRTIQRRAELFRFGSLAAVERTNAKGS